MNELKKIEDSFEDTLKNSDLANLATDSAEAIFDTFIKEGIVQDIPIIKSIVGVYNTAISIKEYLFIKKMISFLAELNSIPTEKRKEVIEKIDSSDKYKIKVGEKLLYIVEKSEDHQKSSIVGILFAAFIEGKLNYTDFLRATNIVERIMYDDLLAFVKGEWEQLHIEQGSPFEMVNGKWKELHIDEVVQQVNVGLAYLESSDISVEDQTERDASNRYVVTGNEQTISISEIGKKMRKILKTAKI